MRLIKTAEAFFLILIVFGTDDVRRVDAGSSGSALFFLTMKSSDYIQQIRALKDIKPDARYYTQLDGEQIPNIHQAHMSALETERQRDQARRLVAELFGLLEGSVEGPGVTREREDEINGLLLLWGLRENPNTPAAWNGESPNARGDT